MKFKNEKEFFKELCAFQQKQPFSLVRRGSDLKARFWILVPKRSIGKFLILLFVMWLGLLGGSALFISAIMWMGNIWTGLIGLICLVIGFIAFRSLSGNDPENPKSVYNNRKKIASELLAWLKSEIESKENELVSLQTKRDEIVSGSPALMMEMKHVQFIEDLIPYMSAEQLLKYLQDVQLPLRLKEIDEKIKNVTAELVYLKEEKSFLTEISEHELKK